MNEQPVILAVDDERHMLKLIEFNLRKTGAEILMAGSAEEALATMRERKVDLVVTDFILKGMDGFDLVRNMRESPPLADIPVILLTAKGQVEIKEQAEGLGIHAFLNKPFSPMELVQQAQSAMRPGE